ncbi:MAG: hypothetical protein KDK45_10040, partial [Leptospiraceae bacterium]|nr:hypothetical protein [Leptospiraceae bacterium]
MIFYRFGALPFRTAVQPFFYFFLLLLLSACSQAKKKDTGILYSLLGLPPASKTDSAFVKGVVRSLNKPFLVMPGLDLYWKNSHEELRTVQTDENGNFEIQLPPGSYNLKLKKNELELGEANILLLEDIQILFVEGFLLEIKEYKSPDYYPSTELNTGQSFCQIHKDMQNNQDYKIFTFDTSNKSQSQDVGFCLSSIEYSNIYIMYTKTPDRNIRNAEPSITNILPFQSQIHPNYVDEFLYKSKLKTRKNASKPMPKKVSNPGSDIKTWLTATQKVEGSCYTSLEYGEIETRLRYSGILAGGVPLRIWVGDRDWADSGQADKKLNEEKIQSAVQHFSSTDGIYSVLRNISGEEWGEHSYTNLISGVHPGIDIVYFDIHCDNSLSGILGYYNSANNFLKSEVPFSNEALVLFIDSVFLASKSGSSWEESDEAPTLSILTLAHEFQHMIHFYRRKVLKGINSEIWFNELSSLMAEDIFLSRLSGGELIRNNRFYKYITHSDCSLSDWDKNPSHCDVFTDYSLTWSFAAFLIRHFGPEILRD